MGWYLVMSIRWYFRLKSAQPFCGTNPLCFAAPQSAEASSNSKTGALCLDMATSIVPWNTVRNAEIENVPLAEGWAVDENGQDTTDASQAKALYPMGEHKGSGLGLMIDVLCAMLSNSPFGPNIPKCMVI